MFKEIETYADLKAALEAMTPEQLAQQIQVAKPTPMPLVELQVGLAIGTVAEMGFYAVRSTYDNRYHPEDIVLLTDHNPFGEDGAIAYHGLDDDAEAIYGKNGPTPEIEQIDPREHNDANVSVRSVGHSIGSPKEVSILRNRMKKHPVEESNG